MRAASSDTTFTLIAPDEQPAHTAPTPDGPSKLDLPLRTTLLSPDLPPERRLAPRLPADRALAARAWHVLAQTARADLPVRYLGTLPVFGGHRVYAGGPNDWVLANAAADPLLHDRDGFPVPERILKDLRRVAREVHFDGLFVAHEVPQGAVSEEEPLTAEALLPPPPSTVRGLSGDLGVVGQRLWTFAALPLVGGSVLAALAAGVLVLTGGLSVGPVLLGVVVAPDRPLEPGEPAAWFYLGHWAFDGA